MTPEDMAALRKPFDKSQIGKLPKPYKSDSPKGPCKECGGHHGLPAMHLDFVGHAVTTARLLHVDPQWSWEPMGYDEQGLPAIDKAGNLWIKLTVCGITRIGVGDGTSAKIAIGDAIRNAAMRFGVALDLWAKQDLDAPPQATSAPSAPPEQSPLQIAKTRATVALKALHPDWDNRALNNKATDDMESGFGLSLAEATATQWNDLAEQWENERAAAA